MKKFVIDQGHSNCVLITHSKITISKQVIGALNFKIVDRALVLNLDTFNMRQGFSLETFLQHEPYWHIVLAGTVNF